MKVNLELITLFSEEDDGEIGVWAIYALYFAYFESLILCRTPVVHVVCLIGFICSIRSSEQFHVKACGTIPRVYQLSYVQVNKRFMKFEGLHKKKQRQDWDTDMLCTSTYLCWYIDVYSMSVSQSCLCSFLCNPYITLRIS